MKASVTGLGRTERGNLKIIDAMQKLNQFKIDISAHQMQIVQANGGVVPLDIETQMMKYANSYVLLSEDERNSMKNLTQRIVRTGTDNETGRKVIEFEDGRIEFAPGESPKKGVTLRNLGKKVGL